MTKRLYGIFGTGGLAREVMPVCHAMLERRFPNTEFELVFVSGDANPPLLVNDCRVMREQDFLAADVDERFYNIAINDSRLREKIAEAVGSTARPFSIVADSHHRGSANEIGEGAILCPFTSVTSNARIGRFFQANHYARVAHDCVIGDFVTFAPSVQCNGGVIIERHAYIGSGAVIKQSMPERPMVIGEGAVVGMGAVVTKSVPPFSTVVGNPARIIRTGA